MLHGGLLRADERPSRAAPPFKSARLPASKVAYTLHIGPYEPLHLASKTVRAWGLEEGLTVGQKREVYFVGSQETDEPSRYRTEVQYALEPERKGHSREHV